MTMTRLHLLAYGTLIFLCGVLATRVFLDTDTAVTPAAPALQTGPAPANTAAPETAPSAARANRDDYLNLQRQLLEEVAARQALEQQLAALVEKIQGLPLMQANGGDAAPALPPAAMPGLAPEPVSAHSGGDSPLPATERRSWIDEQVLLDAGLSLDTAMSVKQQFERLEMDKLYLRDRATREGWIGTARYVEEVEKLSQSEQSIRGQIGEDSYGAYLYATGQPNQVYVESMLDSSPAQMAGLLPGDVLVKYGDRHIYTWNDVRTATATGQAGEQVQVLIRRNGELIQTYINRGPLGIRMGVSSAQP